MQQIDAEKEMNPNDPKSENEGPVKQIKFTKKIGRKTKDKKTTDHIIDNNASTSQNMPHTYAEKKIDFTDVETLRQSIQAICQSTNPLGKSMDFVNEDVESMAKEHE